MPSSRPRRLPPVTIWPNRAFAHRPSNLLLLDWWIAVPNQWEGVRGPSRTQVLVVAQAQVAVSQPRDCTSATTFRIRIRKVATRVIAQHGNRSGISDGDDVVAPVGCQPLDAADHPLRRHLGPRHKLQRSLLSRGEYLHVRPANIDDQYLLPVGPISVSPHHRMRVATDCAHQHPAPSQFGNSSVAIASPMFDCNLLNR